MILPSHYRNTSKVKSSAAVWAVLGWVALVSLFLWLSSLAAQHASPTPSPRAWYAETPAK